MVESFRILILLMNDLSGGIIKLGSVCNINRMKKYDDFEVSIMAVFNKLIVVFVLIVQFGIKL